MKEEYIYVTGQDGEIYEVRPTDALLDFLQRLAEGENEEPVGRTLNIRAEYEASILCD